MSVVSRKGLGSAGIRKWGVNKQTSNMELKCTVSRSFFEEIEMKRLRNSEYSTDRTELIRSLLRDWVNKK